MILVDTSGYLAAQAPDQPNHERCAAVLRSSPGPFVLSPFVVAELDSLVAKLLGVPAELRLLAELAGSAYLLPPITQGDLEESRAVIERFPQLGVGLTDASLVVLSRRLGTLDLLTLDERHFRVLRGAEDKPFRLLPTDLRR